MNNEYQKLAAQLQSAIDIIDAVISKVASDGNLPEDAAENFYDETESAVISLQTAQSILDNERQ